MDTTAKIIDIIILVKFKLYKILSTNKYGYNC
jgi:hypothetical protein